MYSDSMKLTSLFLIPLSLLWLTPSLRGQGIVINEVLASNSLDIRDEDGDRPDWVELLNTSAVPVDVGGFGISDDSRDPLKWVLPRVVVQPGEFLLLWCSGKDRVTSVADVLSDAAVAASFFPTAVTADDPWTYTVGFRGDPMPEGWTELEFDDSTWGSGLPGFGFGFDHVITEVPTRVGGLLLRRRFQLADPDSLATLVLRAEYNDGFVLFLNGERILEVNHPEGELEFGNRATRTVNVPSPVEDFDLSEHRDLLRSGENVVAVMALNILRANGTLFFRGELGRVLPPMHTNFSISRSGPEAVILTDSRGELADAVVLPEQTTDDSYGRFPDGSGDFAFMPLPTAQRPNSRAISTEPLPERLLEIQPESGRYAEPVTVSLTAHYQIDGQEVRYSLDGEQPTRESPLYTGPFMVTDDATVRAAILVDDVAVAEAAPEVYLGLSEMSRGLELPFLAITMEPSVFEALHLDNQARNRESERPGFLHVFDGGGQPAASTGFGLRLHGGAGRGGGLDIKKSYKAYFRREYGEGRLRYPLIETTDVEEFDKLVLRANFNDAFRNQGTATFIRDQLVREVHEEMGALVSHGTWRSLFVNGDYRGIYNVVERMDKEFFASYFPEHGTDWDVIKTGTEVLDGTVDDWTDLLDFFRAADLSDDTFYEQARAWVDVENFTSYMLLNLWADNHDWPHNNWYVARPRVPDGRWIFLSWDAEFGQGLLRSGRNVNLFRDVLAADTAFSRILAGLLANASYREFFLEELDRYLEGILSVENVLAHIERLSAIIRPDMDEEVAVTTGSVGLWEDNLESMRSFARTRAPLITRFIVSRPVFAFPYVVASTPERITADGVADVLLEGGRFTPSTEVFFGDLPSPRVEWLSDLTLRAVVPLDSRLEGFPAVTVADPEGGRRTTKGILEVTLVEPGEFRRGDSSGDGSVSILDVVELVHQLRGGENFGGCDDALDVDDSGGIDIVDALALLEFLFGRGPAPAEPFLACGIDPTADGLACEVTSCVAIE